MRPIRLRAALLLPLAVACSTPPPAPTPVEAAAPTEAAAEPARAVVPSATAAAPSEVPEAPEAPIVLPPGSGDYREVLTLARRHKAGKMTFDELQRALIARKLPPHGLGDGYLMTPVPAPPPGTPFIPEMMPDDWEGTWGEVAMAFWLGALSRDEYDRLHAAAHPQCPKR